MNTNELLCLISLLVIEIIKEAKLFDMITFWIKEQIRKKSEVEIYEKKVKIDRKYKVKR